MSGRDPAVPDGLADNNGHIWSYTNAGAWELAREPLDDATGQVYSVSIDNTAGVSPGLSFGDALYAAYSDRDIGLVPCAKGGSSIQEWQLDRSKPQEDTLYGSCLLRIRAAQERGRVMGFLFYQGEADTTRFAKADRWGESFLRMVDDLRADLGDAGLPVIFAQLATVLPPDADHRPAWDHLKTLQAGITKDRVAMVRTDDLPLMGDGLHLSAESEVELGRRFAQALIDLFPDRLAQ